MNHRALVLILAICMCASILYASVVYLDTTDRREPKASSTVINAEARQVIILPKTATDCHQSSERAKRRDAQAVEPYSAEEQHFHPNHAVLSSVRPKISASSTAITTRAPTSVKGVQIPFDPYGTDTMVYIHIQKTGGSEFLEHLVTAQIPLERVTLSNDSGKVPSPEPNSQSIQLCRTNPTGGWKRSGGYLGNGSDVFINHELCPRDWEYPKGDTWLVSEKTTAWNCGVHAIYTDFKRCLRNSATFNHIAWKKYRDRVTRLSQCNRFHYVVLLRHPLLRYISEYLHVSRGACWAREEVCRNKINNYRSRRQFRCPEHFLCKKDIVEKFSVNLTLEKFSRCKGGWSVNRMTLALADHDVATCSDRTKYSREERDQLLLASAKSNLRKFSYFGLNEFIVDSGTLFERTFGIVLRHPIQEQSPNVSNTGHFVSSITQEKEINIYKMVVQNNLLDLELYEYALEIFSSRMRTIGKELNTNTLNYIETLNELMHKVEL